MMKSVYIGKKRSHHEIVSQDDDQISAIYSSTPKDVLSLTPNLKKICKDIDDAENISYQF
mgnify:CR=1 FL=1